MNANLLGIRPLTGLNGQGWEKHMAVWGGRDCNRPDTTRSWVVVRFLGEYDEHEHEMYFTELNIHNMAGCFTSNPDAPFFRLDFDTFRYIIFSRPELERCFYAIHKANEKSFAPPERTPRIAVYLEFAGVVRK